jgi:hypothetical protein
LKLKPPACASSASLHITFISPCHKHCTSSSQHHINLPTQHLFTYHLIKKAKQHTAKMGVSTCISFCSLPTSLPSLLCFTPPQPLDYVIFKTSIEEWKTATKQNGMNGTGHHMGRRHIHDNSLTECVARTEDGCCQRGRRRRRRRRSTSGTWSPRAAATGLSKRVLGSGSFAL